MNVRAHLLPLIFVGILAACSPMGEEQVESTPTPVAPVASVTWYEHIQPIMQRTCQRCHTADGQAPTDFSTYEAAAPFADLIAAYVKSGEMPPASADPTCRPYQDSETKQISDEERALFASWAEQDAPLGLEADAPAPVTYQHKLSDPNLEVKIAKPYKPSFDSTGNTYTCFVVETGQANTVYINGIQVAIDKAELVHHVVLYRDEDGDALTTFGTEPFKCMHSSDTEGLGDVWDDWAMMASWGPGGPPIEFPEGMGLALRPGQVLVLQMHYFESSAEASELADQSGLTMRTVDVVEHEVVQTAVGPSDFVIPAGDDNYSVEYTLTYPYPQALTVLGVFPHMHVLGKSYSYWIEGRNGTSTCLVESERYDFHNQETYMWTEPVKFGLGDTLHARCTWNNSTSNPDLIYNPPQDVGYGEGTDDEMCFFLTFITI